MFKYLKTTNQPTPHPPHPPQNKTKQNKQALSESVKNNTGFEWHFYGGFIS